jgi:hypothetical protein
MRLARVDISGETTTRCDTTRQARDWNLIPPSRLGVATPTLHSQHSQDRKSTSINHCNMGKGEPGSTKAIANAIKAKGELLPTVLRVECC